MSGQVIGIGDFRIRRERMALRSGCQHTRLTLHDDGDYEKTVELRAAQKVEKAWRSRTMVPTCPHCAEAIFPEDGLGSGMANRELALRRRGVGAAKT